MFEQQYMFETNTCFEQHVFFTSFEIGLFIESYYSPGQVVISLGFTRDDKSVVCIQTTHDMFETNTRFEQLASSMVVELLLL